MYYLRTKAAAQAIQFTVDKSKLKKMSSVADSSKQEDTAASTEKSLEDNMAAMVCSLANKDDCLMCSG